MAIKTFSTGEVLTASDTNTYLANSGLVYVYSATVGNNVGSFTPATAVFSSTYDNYLVMYTGGACSAQGDIGMILGSTTSGYAHSVIYTGWSNAPTVAAAGAVSGAGAASWGRAGIAEPDSCYMRLDIASPNLPKRTIAWGSFVGSDSTRVGGSFSGFLANTTVYTNFTLTPSSGLLSGGVVSVYGYRKA